MRSKFPEIFKKMDKKKKIFLALAILLTIANLTIISAMAWFSYRRSAAKLMVVDKPQMISITAGDGENVTYLDISDIDVQKTRDVLDDDGNVVTEADGTPKTEYITDHRIVFGVCGDEKEGSTPLNYYDLQIGHTNNIAFDYKLYRAEPTTGEVYKNDVIAYYGHI